MGQPVGGIHLHVPQADKNVMQIPNGLFVHFQGAVAAVRTRCKLWVFLGTGNSICPQASRK